MIQVVLADDHLIVRTGIKKILQKTADIVVIGEAGDGEQAIDLVSRLYPDVLVLDIEMPGMRGYEVARRLHDEGPFLPILALSAYEDKQYILGMLSNGAYGYLTKDEAPEILAKAVRGVAGGEKGWVSRRLAAQIAIWLQAEWPAQVRWSQPQGYLLKLLAAGESTSRIAAVLGMNEAQAEDRLKKAVHAVRASLGLLIG